MTQYLTGLRAYAALAVLMIHTLGGFAEHWPMFWRNLVHNGVYGVVVFFTLSGFVIAMSIDRADAFDFRRFMIRRFRRIAPLYYAACVFAVLLSGSGDKIFSLLYHLTFLNAFDVRYVNDLISVEWSVSIEMVYYPLLPLAVLLINRRHGWAVVILAAAAIYATRFVMKDIAPDDLKDVARTWAPQSYALAFALGALAYKLYRDRPALIAAVSRPAASLLILAAVAFQIATQWFDGRIFYAAVTAAIILTSTPVNRLASLVLGNPVALYLGRISYSIYLTHVFVIGAIAGVTDQPFARLAVIVAATVAVSSLTYVLIERPFLKAAPATGPSARPA